MKKTIAVLAVMTAAATASHAQFARIINPSSSDLFVGQTSNGSSWGVDTIFEAGIFTGAAPSYSGGMVVGDWSWLALPTDALTEPNSPWVPIEGTNQGYFDYVLNYSSNAAPFAPGTQGYIWGFDDRNPGAAQWILFTNPSWTLPALPTANPDPTIITWSLLDAGTQIVGGFGSFDAAGRTMTSVEVIPEPSTYALIFGLGILGFLGYRRFRK
jgi:hypothetical protein